MVTWAEVKVILLAVSVGVAAHHSAIAVFEAFALLRTGHRWEPKAEATQGNQKRPLQHA